MKAVILIGMIAGLFVVGSLIAALVRTFTAKPWVQGTYYTPTTSHVDEYGNCSGGMCMPSRGDNLTGWTPEQGQRYDRAETPYQRGNFTRGDLYTTQPQEQPQGTPVEMPGIRVDNWPVRHGRDK